MRITKNKKCDKGSLSNERKTFNSSKYIDSPNNDQRNINKDNILNANYYSNKKSNKNDIITKILNISSFINFSNKIINISSLDSLSSLYLKAENNIKCNNSNNKMNNIMYSAFNNLKNNKNNKFDIVKENNNKKTEIFNNKNEINEIYEIQLKTEKKNLDPNNKSSRKINVQVKNNYIKEKSIVGMIKTYTYGQKYYTINKDNYPNNQNIINHFNQMSDRNNYFNNINENNKRESHVYINNQNNIINYKTLNHDDIKKNIG